MTKLILLITLVWLFSCVQENQNQNQPITPQPEYTSEDAGEWEAIKQDHLPFTDVNLKEKSIFVKVESKTFNETHYIEKIGIMNQDKVDLAVKSFNRTDKTEVAFQFKTFPEDWKHTKIYVKCNLHDLWTTTLEEEIAKTRAREREKR